MQPNRPEDSGSSLITEDPESKRHIQIGIVYGSLEQCNDQKYPSLYARLDDYNILSFIRETAFGDKIEPVGVKGIKNWFNIPNLVERGLASSPKMEYQVFLCIFQKNSAMATYGLKEMGKFLWEGREKGV